VTAVVPADRFPALSDKLPYVDATMLEIMGLKTVLPLSFAHRTVCDTSFGGFFIPANTQVAYFTNILDITNLHKYWKKTFSFFSKIINGVIP